MKKYLPEVCKIQYGFPFDSAQFSTSEGMPLIRIRDVVRGYSETFTTESYQDEYIVHQDDLLIGMDGEFNIAKWGKVDALLNQRVCRLIPSSEIDKNYLFYFMPRALKRIEEKTPFVTVKHLSAKELNKIRVPILPLDEQRRIAATLDKVTDLISKRRQQLDKLDELVKARFVEMFGDPAFNPNKYLKIKIVEAVTDGYIEKPLDGNHGEKHPKASEYVDDGVPFIMANNITEQGIVDLIHCAHITYKRALMLDKGFAHNMDVLITHKGTIGRTAILHTDLDFVMLTPQVTYYRVKKALDPYYLKEYFSSEYFQMKLSNLAASGGSTRAYAGITAQLNLPILIPPMQLQCKFARFVQKTEILKSTVTHSLEKLETLKKALMQEYFG